jgi:aminodeoxyfutalosine synthase
MTATDAILEKAIAGEPLSADDVAAIHATPDVLALGMAADEIRRRRHGSRITYVRVQNVPLEAADREIELFPAAGELRLVGSLADRERALAAVRRIAARAGGPVPVHGFSLAEVESLIADDASKGADLLMSLRDAGLERLAEAPIDALQSPDRWIDTAERVGLGISRATVDRAPGEARQGLIERARTILQAHPSIAVLAPLPQRVGLHPSTGFEDVRLVALTRLLVDVPHVQVDWQLYGPKLAQVALTFGADDVDNVSASDDAPEGKRRAALEEIRRNIVAAFGEPVERNGRFERRA